MGEGYAAIKRGRAAVSGGWGQSDRSWCLLCNHSKYTVAFKYVMASGPYSYSWYTYIKIYFFKNTYSIESMFLNLI